MVEILTDCHRFILRYLDMRRGVLHAVRRSELLDALRSAGFDLTDAEMRLAKEDLIEAGYCVCSGPQGYWRPLHDQEVEDSARYLEDKGKDLLHKAKLLRDSRIKELGRQTELVL